MSDTYNRKDEEIKAAHRSQTIIKDGADLAQRIRAGQHLEHDQKGYLLEPSRQRVTDEAVSWHRDRAARMSKEIGIDAKARIADLEKQQQQTRQYVERSVEQVEREQPKQEKQKERSEERER